MSRLSLALSVVTALLLVVWGAAAPAGAAPPPGRSHRPVCPGTVAGHGRCFAHVLTDSNGVPLTFSSPPATSYGPDQFHGGYNLPCSVSGTSAQASCWPFTSFAGVTQTIGIVDAYDDPTIEADLGTYDSYYGLPACTTANGCFRKVNQNGGTTYPAMDSSWLLEIALDVETAHEICQTCKILLVEANASSWSDLTTAEKEAAALGATEISNSYGGSDGSGETQYDSAYDHPGVAVTASTGDSGYGAQYPAASPYVVAVGGTTLNLTSNNTFSSESAWSGAGSGCSGYETASSWQTGMSNWSQTGCGSQRGVADVSADADPNTGAAVYDSTPYGTSQQSGWFQVGGTSLASPLIAGVYALAGGVAPNTNAQQVPYTRFTAGNSHDVTTGSNGSCSGTSMCTAGPGYDGPTGLGSPNGTAGFASGATPPSATNTPTPTSTSTPTNTPTSTSTRTNTPTNTPTRTNTPTPTTTPTGTSSPTTTPTDTPTPTSTPTDTPTPTNMPTSIPTPNTQDFTLTASPDSQTVTRPHNTTYTVSLSSGNGYSGSINLGVSGLPSRTGSSFSVNPVSVPDGGTATSILTVTTQRKTSPAPYTLTIQGTDGKLTHTYSVTLLIQ